TRGRTVERPFVAALALHVVRRVLPRHARAGSTAVFILRPACDRHRDAGLAHGARRTRIELRRLRVTSLSCVARGDSDRTMGSRVFARYGTGARVSSHHPATGVSHRAAADD